MKSSKTDRGDQEQTCVQCSQPLPPSQKTDGGFVLCDNCGNLQSQVTTNPTAAFDRGKIEQPLVSQRYQIGRVLGQGSFGVVYQAFDSLLKRDVAIKAARGKLEGNEAELFVREARAASRVKHPNIVAVHDIVTNGQGIFIVSDLVKGTSLRIWMDENEPDINKSIGLVIKICNAMDCAHRNGVVHRDLKPGNIVVDRSGEPNVLDFGLSQSLDNSLETISQDGIPVGTPAFMAPEQVKGDRRQIDARCDVYAIGIILYQLLTRRLPFAGERSTLYERILNSAPPLVTKFAPSTPKSLEAICLKAISKDPNDRYQSAAEMAEDLRRFLNGDVVKAYGKIDKTVVEAFARRRFFAVVAVVLGITALALSYLVYVDYQRRNPLIPVMIESNPPNAKLEWVRYDAQTGQPDAAQEFQSVAGKIKRLAPGFYRVTATSGDESVEVFRTVPADVGATNIPSCVFNGATVYFPHRTYSKANRGLIEMEKIEVVPLAKINDNAAFFSGGNVTIPQAEMVFPLFNGKSSSTKKFLMNTAEVSWRDLQSVWPELLPPGQSVDEAAHDVPWDVAVAYAEKKGMSLPNVWEIRFAATNGGQTKYPQGDTPPEIANRNIEPGLIQPWDANLSKPPVTGLLTGWDEWTDTPFAILFEKDGQLVPANPELAKSLNTGTGQFPTAWYAISGSTAKSENKLAVETTLRFVRENTPTSTIGFRTVRRLHHVIDSQKENSP